MYKFTANGIKLFPIKNNHYPFAYTKVLKVLARFPPTVMDILTTDSVPVDLF